MCLSSNQQLNELLFQTLCVICNLSLLLNYVIIVLNGSNCCKIWLLWLFNWNNSLIKMLVIYSESLLNMFSLMYSIDCKSKRLTLILYLLY